MKTKILVVDDEADFEILIKQKFRRQIREGIYDFVFASNGQEALDKLAAHPEMDIILSDINMPVMDGLTLLTRLRDVNPIVKTIMVSAYGDMENIRKAMNGGAFDFVCKPVNFADLELTMTKTVAYVQQLRQMLRAIQENNILKMFVDETVINVMARPGFENTLLVSEAIEATVVFVDICGFTALAEKMPADAVVVLLNQYFDQMVKEVIAQGGHVDKFMGDAIMAVFRGDFHLDRAMDAALAIRNRLQTNPPQKLSDGSDYQPRVSIGLNTGEMVSGNIGSASLRRLDYTVIGDAVNMCQRLQAIAKPGQIIITEATYQRVKESFNCQPLEKVNLKNKSMPVMTYEVIE